MPRLLFIAAMSISLASCFSPPEGIYGCEADADCPSGMDCFSGACFSSAPPDWSPTCEGETYALEEGGPCFPFTRCSAGQYVAVPGTPRSDRECEPCPAETFSDAANSGECTSFSECGPGRVLESEGTATRDRVCALAEWSHQVPWNSFEVRAAVDAGGFVYFAFEHGGAIDGYSSRGVDVYVRKYDPDGGLVDTTRFGAPTNVDERLGALVVDDDGNVYVGGTTFGAIQPGASYLGGSADVGGDAWVAKLDGAFELEWIRQFGTVQGDFTRALALDDFGRVYVAGGEDADLDGSQTATSVRAYETDGSLAWQFEVTPQTRAVLPYAVAVDAQRNVHLALAAYGEVLDTETIGSSDAVLAAFDQARELVRVERFGVPGVFTSPRDIAIAEDGSVYVTGQVRGQLTDGDVEGTGFGFVRKLDAEYAHLWTRQFGGEFYGTDYGAALHVNDDGSVLAGGNVSVALPNQTHAGDGDVALLHYSAAGQFIGAAQVGTSLREQVGSQSVFPAQGGLGYVVAGKTRGDFGGENTTEGTEPFIRAMRLELVP